MLIVITRKIRHSVRFFTLKDHISIQSDLSSEGLDIQSDLSHQSRRHKYSCEPGVELATPAVRGISRYCQGDQHPPPGPPHTHTTPQELRLLYSSVLIL